MGTTRVKLGYKRCPRCAEDVKAAAVACKHCQYVFTPEDNARQAASERRTRRNGLIGGSVIVLLVVLSLQYSPTETSSPANPAGAASAGSADAKMQEFLARASASAAVKERLNDPDSFVLVDAQAMPGKTKDGSSNWVVGVTYRAKNGFGGVLTRNAVVSVDQSGNTPLEVSDVDPKPGRHR